jgi:hypothetical protein
MTLRLGAGNVAHAEQLRQRASSLITFFGQAKKVTTERLKQKQMKKLKHSSFPSLLNFKKLQQANASPFSHK